MNTNNITAIIPIRIDSDDRLQNINASISFLLNYYDCNVIVKEVDNIQKFNPPNNSKLKYIFEKCDINTPFHRTKIINEMLNIVNTKYVINYDCDMLIPKSTMNKCISMLNSGYDLVYPYPKETIYYTTKLNEQHIKKFLNDPNNSYMDYIIEKYMIKIEKKELHFFNKINFLKNVICAGGMQFFNTKSYIKGYGENEEFLDWGPEDYERLYRFYLLGYKIGWIDSGNIMHMDHKKTESSNASNLLSLNIFINIFFISLSMRDTSLILYPSGKSFGQ
jgi:hypothetical protein